jgi:hypothetical protein
MSSSRSALYFQPLHDPAPHRWSADLTLDYASMIEYNRLTTADYVLDAELLRATLKLGRDLGSRAFALLDVSAGGAYAGFLDGFLDWYHGTLGLRVSEREKRPRNQFLYTVTPPSGVTTTRSPADLYLNDTRLGLGIRYGTIGQSVLTVTLPTSTRPDGYGRGVPAVGLLNTLRTPVDQRLVYEGSFGVGFTSRHGAFSDYEREVFVVGTSGMRFRLWGRQSIYGNLFYHSPYYHDTTLPSLDLRDLSLDFGWIVGGAGRKEWRIGLTEDLEPGGPGVDLVFRLGRRF